MKLAEACRAVALRAKGVCWTVTAALLLTLTAVDRGHAVPVFGEVGPMRQVDGSTIDVRVWGDEFYKVIESLDGYTLVRDPESGLACYARLSPDGNSLVSTGVQVQETVPPALNLVPGIRINREASAAIVAEARSAFAQHDKEVLESIGFAGGQLRAGPPSVGNVQALVLLIDFSDDQWTIPWQNVDDYCNQIGYTGFGNNGSIRDYFLDASNGVLDYTNYVTPYYYRANNPKTYYTNPAISFGQRARELILEALNHLENVVGHDFSVYDSNADNLIDGLNVFYAGNVNNQWAEGLWPHSSSVNGFTADGKTAFRYQFTNMGSSLRLGTFVHENGHMICYWSDLYDYDSDSAGVGRFCVMCAITSSTNPQHPNGYFKYTAGWSFPTLLTAPQADIPAPSTGNVTYKYDNPGNPFEYYIVENRRRAGRDQFIPDDGLAIWHVDEAGSNNWQQMTPSNHYECTLVQADGLWQLENNIGLGDFNDLYGAPTEPECTPDTDPNTDWWNGSPSGLHITDISVPGANMTFSFGAPLDCNDNGIPDECDISCAPDGCGAFACGTKEDCNQDGRPDECGVAGSCEVDKISRSQSDLFGWSADSSGDTTLIGAPFSSCAAGFSCGSVEVHRFTGGGWTQDDELTASDAGAFDSFGISLAVDGDIAVVGAYGDSCTGGGNCGAAYVFRYDGASWNEEQKLTASSRAAFAYYGASVDVDATANVIVVGAYGESCLAGANCGAVYVYRYNGSSWGPEVRLTAGDAAANDRFGASVSISNFWMFVGADGDDCLGGGECGAAYVFLYWNNVWGEDQKVTAGNGFGFSVVVDGVQAMVGAPLEDCPAGSGCGAAYVYRQIGGVWQPETKFIAETPASFANFGFSLAFRDGRLLAGSYGESCPGDSFCGAAYLYRNTDTAWTLETRLTASDATTNTQLGLAGAIGPDNTILVGAYGAAYGFVVNGPDCDCNAAIDLCDVVDGAVEDGNGNGIPDACESGPPLTAAYPDNRSMNRYFAFDPNAINDGFNVAFQVELKSLDLGSCSGNGAPCRIELGNDDCRICSMSGDACINASVDCQPAGQSCNLTGQTCVNDQAGSVGSTWWVGPQSANGVHLLVSEPFRKVSSAWPSTVHVGDCEVVPRATYGVRAVSVDTGGISDELVVSTISTPGTKYWADAVGSLDNYCTGNWAPCPGGAGDCPGGESCLQQWGLPDGATNFDDVTAAVFLFQSAPGLTVPDVRWVDMHGNDSGAPGSESFDPPNHVANFSDISAIVLAFQGRPYPYDDPGECPDVGAWP